MSAFLISDNTMQDVVAEIMALACEEGFEFDGSRPVTTHDATDIGRKLYMLNFQALHGRYNEPVPEPEAITWTFRPRGASQNRLVRHKSMRCLRYQCSEDGASGTPMFLELERAIGKSAEAVVTALPAYDVAPWGRT